MESIIGKLMFKSCQPGGAGADGDGLEHTQEAGSADGEAPHHPVHVEKHLTLEAILKIQWFKEVWWHQEHYSKKQHDVDKSQVTGGHVSVLRPVIQKDREDAEEKEEGVGWDSNTSLEKKCAP